MDLLPSFRQYLWQCSQRRKFCSKMLSRYSATRLNSLGKVFDVRSWIRRELSANERPNQNTDMGYESVIGLEIHAQVASNSKLFSGAGNSFEADANTEVSQFDASIPGALPVLNKRCVEAAVKASLALSCDINMMSTFDRKHYFYADLPAGYQITQQQRPIARNGKFSFTVADPSWESEPYDMSVRIIQVQLEQDSGRSLNLYRENFTRVDLNRAGIALMEIVTEPDFRTAQEVTSFVKDLGLTLNTIGSSNANMSVGEMRVDASVSLRRHGEEKLGVRTEIKNINTLQGLENAVDFEIRRQQEILNAGGEVENETRAYDDNTRTTVTLRDKEKLHDYRFMPEPNLPPLQLYDSSSFPRDPEEQKHAVNVSALRDSLPQLPTQARVLLMRRHGMAHKQAYLLSHRPVLLELFWHLAAQRALETTQGPIATQFADGLMLVIQGALNRADPDHLQQHWAAVCDVTSVLVPLWQQHRLTGAMVMDLVFRAVQNGSYDVIQAVESEGLWVVDDNNEMDDVIRRLVEGNPDVMGKYRRAAARKRDRLRETFFLPRVVDAGKGKFQRKTCIKRIREVMSEYVEEDN